MRFDKDIIAQIGENVIISTADLRKGFIPSLTNDLIYKVTISEFNKIAEHIRAAIGTEYIICVCKKGVNGLRDITVFLDDRRICWWKFFITDRVL